MCVACVVVFLSCIVCHSSFIFLLITRVIQCAGKWECSLKVKCMYMVCVWARGNLNEKRNQKHKFTLAGVGINGQSHTCSLHFTSFHFTSLAPTYLHSFHCVPPLSDFKRDLFGCSTTQRRRKLYSQTDMLMFSLPQHETVSCRGELSLY